MEMYLPFKFSEVRQLFNFNESPIDLAPLLPMWLPLKSEIKLK